MAEDEIKRRTRHDIIVEILKTARNGKIKTHIMYKAKLSYAQIQEYLPLLVNKGFLEPATVEQGKIRKRVYRTTEKGIKLLDNYESIARLWG